MKNKQRIDLSDLKQMTIAVLLILSAACAPKVQELEKKTPDTPEIQSNDIALQQVYANPFATVGFALKKLDLKKPETEKNIQNLYEIGQILNDQIALDKASQSLNKLQSAIIKNKKEYKDTYYLQLVEEQTKDSLEKSVSETEKKILADTTRIENMITASAADPANKSNAQNNLKVHLEIAQRLIKSIIDKIMAADIFEELKKQIPEKLNAEAKNIITTAQTFDSEYILLTTLTEKLNLVTGYLKKLDIQLDPETATAFTTGQQLGVSIDLITNPKNALQTLAFTWKILTVEERLQYFKPANESLYNLFNKKDEKDIKCLIEGNCTGFISNLILKLGVYPALEKYGVAKIKADLNNAAMGFLTRKINLIAYQKIAQLPETIKKQIRESIEKNIGLVQKFKENFKLNLASGLQKELSAPNLDFYLLSGNEIQLQDQISAMTNDLYLITHSETEQKRIKQLTLIEKVISLVDFSNNKENLMQNGLSEFLKNPKENFLMSSLQDSSNTLLVKDQAAALKFLSLMVTATADWKTGPFDHGITDIRAQDLITDFKSDELKQSLFPKVELFNICFSYAVQILKQIQSDKSLVYLVDNNNLRIPISDYLSGANRPTVALGAASDQKNNRVLNTTKISDLALLIDALSGFSKAIVGIENSQSTILKNEDIKNQIMNAKKNVDLLVVTLANFISSQMIGPKNLAADSYDFETKILDQNYKLANQVAAISALVSAYETTHIDIYLFSAKELYYSMNKNYFDPQLKFYKNNLNPDLQTDMEATSAVKNDVLGTLNQLITLRKHLSRTSQVQFDRIFENWYVALLL